MAAIDRSRATRRAASPCHPSRALTDTTCVVGLRNSGMIAPMILYGPINGELFQAFPRIVRCGSVRCTLTVARLQETTGIPMLM